MAGFLLALTLLAGCGASASDDQQIRGVVDHFTVAASEGDPSACALTTGQLRMLCRGYLGQAHGALSSLTGAAISKVVVSGSTATVAFANSSDIVTLEKSNGKWLVASA
jgi:hypothetical protein